jgi:hypothetical protein
MHTYHVTYFYLATGMEGRADTADHGYVQAWSSKEAIEKVGHSISSDPQKYVREWGLSATRVKTDRSRINDI